MKEKHVTTIHISLGRYWYRATLNDNRTRKCNSAKSEKREIDFSGQLQSLS